MQDLIKTPALTEGNRACIMGTSFLENFSLAIINRILERYLISLQWYLVGKTVEVATPCSLPARGVEKLQ